MGLSFTQSTDSETTPSKSGQGYKRRFFCLAALNPPASLLVALNGVLGRGLRREGDLSQLRGINLHHLRLDP